MTVKMYEYRLILNSFLKTQINVERKCSSVAIDICVMPHGYLPSQLRVEFQNTRISIIMVQF